MTKRAQLELLEAKQVLMRAKALSGVSAKDIAIALDCEPNIAYKLLEAHALDDNMRLADLLLLSKSDAMRGFVTEVIGAVQANFDHQHYRVCDLERMAGNTATRELARTALRTVAAQLWPEMRSTMELAEVDNGEV